MPTSANDADRPVSSDDERLEQPTAAQNMGDVRGRVVTRSGQPVADCVIDTATTSEPKVAIAEIAMVSGPDGSFGRDLLAATYVFTAYSTNATGAQLTGRSTEIRIKAQQTATVTIVLQE